MVIFGWKQTARELAMLTAQCRRCGTHGWHRLYRVITWFTLFFLPVIPLHAGRRLVCGACGERTSIPRAEADRLAGRPGHR